MVIVADPKPDIESVPFATSVRITRDKSCFLFFFFFFLLSLFCFLFFFFFFLVFLLRRCPSNLAGKGEANTDYRYVRQNGS